MGARRRLKAQVLITTMSIHDEEVLGKAYDAVLMRRLLGYLWPYRLQVVIALASIICASVLQLAQPYLMKAVSYTHLTLPTN